MKIRRTFGDIVFDSFNIFLMIALMVIMVVPILHVVSVSFSEGPEVLKGGLFLYPKGFNFTAYEKVLADDLIGVTYLNTILYTVSHTFLVLLLTSMTAYPLSIKTFKFKKPVTIFLAITMFIGGGMIPTYLLMRDLGLINNRLVMIIPFCVGAYNVILFKTFFGGIDSGIRESAKIDGASDIRILFQIILPLSKAILATIGLFTIVAKWNEWFPALIYLNEESKYPVQMVLRKILFNSRAMQDMDKSVMALIQGNEITPQNIQMATIVVITLPIMCIYPFIQKHFAKGVMIGSLKG